MSALEAAIADTGALIVQLEKYRRGAAADAVAAVRDALALGDAARRLHRRDALDDAEAGRLLAAARAVTERLHAVLRAVREEPAYRAAVAAHRAGDQRALGATIPAVFAHVVGAPAPPDLFVGVPWRRRGRPAPPADVAAEVARLRDAGLPAAADDLAPGQDAALPAVALEPVAPDEVVVLRLPAGTIPLPVYRIETTGEHLVYTARLRAAFHVRLAAEPGDEQERVELDFAAYRAELASALAATGVSIEG